jgi:hypothetical protein
MVLFLSASLLSFLHLPPSSDLTASGFDMGQPRVLPEGIFDHADEAAAAIISPAAAQVLASWMQAARSQPMGTSGATHADIASWTCYLGIN